MTNNNNNNRRGPGRPKGSKNLTPGERLAALEAQFARKKAELLLKMEAKMQEATTKTVLSSIEKALARAIRERETAIGNAQRLIHGSETRESRNGTIIPRCAPIHEKIENAKRRLAAMEAAYVSAATDLDIFPGEVSKLKSLLEAVENGEEVEMPTDLRPVKSGAQKSEVEIEASTPYRDNDMR